MIASSHRLRDPRPARQVRSRTFVAVGLVTLLSACGGPAPVEGVPIALDRSGPFGSLRDLVLIERSIEGRPFVLFVDRFEATRADWVEFAATAAGRAVDAAVADTAGDPSLPVGGMDLAQARAFARWRLGRLPRADEWFTCALGDGRNRFPWGSREDATRANTGELDLFEPTPVGTFESGRRAEGNQPYDLIGNVSEWTESVSPSWCVGDRGIDGFGRGFDPLGYQAACARVRRIPALMVHAPLGGLLAPFWAARVGGVGVPHEVLGADFQSPMSATTEAVPAGDRRTRTGLRVCATPRELLLNLLAFEEQPDTAARTQLRRFVGRAGHRAALASAWPEVVAEAPPRGGFVADLLRAELSGAAPAGGR